MDIGLLLNKFYSSNCNNIVIDGLKGSGVIELAEIVSKEFGWEIVNLSNDKTVTLMTLERNKIYINYSVIKGYAFSVLDDKDVREICKKHVEMKTLTVLLLPDYERLAHKNKDIINLKNYRIAWEELREAFWEISPKLTDKLIHGEMNVFLDFLSYKLGVRFIESLHQYVRDNKAYKSVTSVIRHLEGELELTPEFKERRTQAGIKGTALHEYIENYYRYGIGKWPDNVREDVKEEMMERMVLWKQWDEAYKPRPLFLELRFINKKYGFAGTIDFVGKIGQDMWIIDWKTQYEATEWKWTYQLNAYALALDELKEELGLEYKQLRVGVLHLPKGNKNFVELDYKKDIQDDFVMMCKLLIKINIMKGGR